MCARVSALGKTMSVYTKCYTNKLIIIIIIINVALVSCLQKSVCHAALSYDTSDILLSIPEGKSGGTDVSITVSVAFDEAYKTHGH